MYILENSWPSQYLLLFVNKVFHYTHDWFCLYCSVKDKFYLSRFYTSLLQSLLKDLTLLVIRLLVNNLTSN